MRLVENFEDAFAPTRVFFALDGIEGPLREGDAFDWSVANRTRKFSFADEFAFNTSIATVWSEMSE